MNNHPFGTDGNSILKHMRFLWFFHVLIVFPSLLTWMTKGFTIVLGDLKDMIFCKHKLLIHWLSPSTFLTLSSCLLLILWHLPLSLMMQYISTFYWGEITPRFYLRYSNVSLGISFVRMSTTCYLVSTYSSITLFRETCSLR